MPVMWKSLDIVRGQYGIMEASKPHGTERDRDPVPSMEPGSIPSFFSQDVPSKINGIHCTAHRSHCNMTKYSTTIIIIRLPKSESSELGPVENGTGFFT